jgi:hypothetical protein
MVKMTKTEQARRFEEMARQVGADETGEAFERAFGKIVPPKRRPKPEPKSKKPSR